MQNIREKEIQLLGKMLSLTTGGKKVIVLLLVFRHGYFCLGLGPGISSVLNDFTEQWKILIYDQDGRDIISPLLNVGALRQKGVTLHLMVLSASFTPPMI